MPPFYCMGSKKHTHNAPEIGTAVATVPETPNFCHRNSEAKVTTSEWLVIHCFICMLMHMAPNIIMRHDITFGAQPIVMTRCKQHSWKNHMNNQMRICCEHPHQTCGGRKRQRCPYRKSLLSKTWGWKTSNDPRLLDCFPFREQFQRGSLLLWSINPLLLSRLVLAFSLGTNLG